MSWLKKIFQPKTYSTFEQNKYDINSAEYKQLKKDLKAANVKFGHKEKVAFKQAVREGKLGAYMDSTEIDAKFKETMGLSLSNKIGKTDPTQDIEEAQRLAKAAELDCDMDKVLKHLENAKATYPQFESQVLETTGMLDKELDLNNAYAQKDFEKALSDPNGFMGILDEMSLS